MQGIGPEKLNLSEIWHRSVGALLFPLCGVQKSSESLTVNDVNTPGLVQNCTLGSSRRCHGSIYGQIFNCLASTIGRASRRCYRTPGVDWSPQRVPVHHHCQIFIGFACFCVSQQGAKSYPDHGLRFGNLVQALTRAAFALVERICLEQRYHRKRLWRTYLITCSIDVIDSG